MLHTIYVGAAPVPFGLPSGLLLLGLVVKHQALHSSQLRRGPHRRSLCQSMSRGSSRSVDQLYVFDVGFVD
jgi:hypothetical protein